jgi:hypothetical protein
MDVGEPGNFSNPKARPSVPHTQTIGHRFHIDFTQIHGATLAMAAPAAGRDLICVESVWYPWPRKGLDFSDSQLLCRAPAGRQAGDDKSRGGCRALLAPRPASFR